MNKSAQRYANSIILIGLIALVYNFRSFNFDLNYGEVLLFMVLIILSELISVETSSFSAVSLGFSIAFTSIVILEPSQAAAIIFFGLIFAIFEDKGEYKHILNSSFFKRLFNASSYYITALLSGYYFHYMNSIHRFHIGQYGVFALLSTIILYLLVNSIIFMGLFALLSQMSFKDMVMKNVWALRNFFTLSPIGIMMLLFYTSYGWIGLIIFLGPLFLARYSFKLYLNMKEVYLETITALTNAIDAKDEYTNGHSQRVAEYSMVLGQHMNLNEPHLEVLKTAALLHDVGKIGISDSILLKPGKLDEFEYEMIRNHPMIGANIIDGIEFLDKAKLYISQHHEFFDGNGYPKGLTGADMPIESMILSVADAFDAMTTNRAYRKAFSEEKALSILQEERGKQFAPKVVDAMLEIKEARGSVIIHVD